MAEYIEKEGVKKSINFLFDIRLNVAPEIKQSVLDLIDGERAADVQPVKRGRWIIVDDVEHFIAICSECGRTEDSRDIKDMPYCHCGARMDGDSDE